MKSNEYWKTMETELQVLKSKRGEMNKGNSTAEQRQALSKQIHLLSVKINQHNKVAKRRAENPIDRSNTLIHKMFGKSERDLSPDEYREYNRVQHRLRRRELKRINCNQKKEATIKTLWIASCSGDIDTLRNQFSVYPQTINKRYRAFGREHSLIMGAYRNGNYDVVDYLISIGETITDEEKSEADMIMNRMKYLEKINK